MYGMTAGLAFALAAWGLDAVQLAAASAAFPWIKFIPGLLIALTAGGLVGWLTIRIGSHAAALGFWLLLAVLLAECMLLLPLKITPLLVQKIDPSLARWIDFVALDSEWQVRMIGFVTIGLAAGIAGLLEINLAEQYLISSAKMGTVGPLLVCVILLGVVGSSSDYILNSSFREPVQEMDTLIQFAADNLGKEVAPEAARKAHLSTVKPLGDLVLQPRKILMIGNDPGLGRMEMMVDFGGRLVECVSMYNTPVHCQPIP